MRNQEINEQRDLFPVNYDALSDEEAIFLDTINIVEKPPLVGPDANIQGKGT